MYDLSGGISWRWLGIICIKMLRTNLGLYHKVVVVGHARHAYIAASYEIYSKHAQHFAATYITKLLNKTIYQWLSMLRMSICFQNPYITPIL